MERGTEREREISEGRVHEARSLAAPANDSSLEKGDGLSYDSELWLGSVPFRTETPRKGGTTEIGGRPSIIQSRIGCNGLREEFSFRKRRDSCGTIWLK